MNYYEFLNTVIMNKKKRLRLDNKDFIVYDLENTGDLTKLNIKPEELQNHLNPEQVLIIIREDLRRIYIWKGAKSPVRRRFISSRVALDILRDLKQKDRDYKIISIDPIDEENRLRSGNWAKGEYGDLKHGGGVLF